MLPEAGATELIFLAAVALIVVGPKDLPALLRKVGQFTAKMRGLAAEFRSSFDELARQSELDELRREVDALRTGAYAQPAQQEIQQHFDALHREFDAPPPPSLDHQTILPGPDAPSATGAASAPGAVTPVSDGPEGARVEVDQTRSDILTAEACDRSPKPAGHVHQPAPPPGSGSERPA